MFPRLVLCFVCLFASTEAVAQGSFTVFPTEASTCHNVSLIVSRRFDSDCDWVETHTVRRDGNRLDVEIEAIAETDACREVEITRVFELELGLLEVGDYQLDVRWVDEPPGIPPATLRFDVNQGRCTPGYRNGDANSDLLLNLTDPVAVLDFLFLGGDVECRQAADSDGSGEVSISDAIYSLNYLFVGGPPPMPSFDACTPVSIVGVLSCEEPSCIVPEREDSIWVAKPDGCVQCLPCEAPGLAGAIEELERFGFEILDSTLIALPTCLACKVCSSGLLYGARIRLSDLEGLIELGWFPAGNDLPIF